MKHWPAVRAVERLAHDLTKGRIAEGYDADVLAIDGDPLTEPGSLHAIRAVFLRGERLR